MKKLFKILGAALAITVAAQAAETIKISQLPLGSASTAGVNDSFPYVDAVANTTKRMKLSDLPNLSSFQTEFNVLIPSQTGNSGKCLLTDGTSTAWGTCGAGGGGITALTGDVTASGTGSVAATIAANAVTNAKAAQMAAHTFKGNNTSSTANAIDLSQAQLTAEINAMVGDSGSGGTKGSAPAPATGDAAAGKFLKADGTWAVPPGSSGTVPIASGGTGQTTKTAAFDALSPMTTSGDVIYGGASGTGTRLAKGSDGQILTLASGFPSWQPASGGVAGPVSSTNTALARWSGTGGGTLLNSGVLVDGSNNVSGINNLTLGGTTTLATGLTGVVKASSGVVSAASLVNADVSSSAAIDLSKLGVLTGYTSGAGTVAGTDTVLQAIQKLNGNDALKAPLASPALTGAPTAPTQTAGDNSTKIATTAYVATAVAAGGSGIASINGDTTSAQVITSGTTGTNVAVSTTAGTTTINIPDAASGARGVITTGAQTLSGNKTFLGSISASNLSGNNSGDVNFSAVGSTPNSTGASLSSQAITLQPADGSNPGLLTSGTQTIGGAKTFTGTVSVPTCLQITGFSQLCSGTADPTVTATTASVGSLYLNQSTGVTYQKQDAGSSVNWKSIGASAVVGPWTAYTPTLGGAGTATNINFFYRQVGTSYQVQGSFTTGTTAASLATISFPNAAALDTTVIGLSNTTAAAGPAFGSWQLNGAGSSGVLITATGTSTALVYFGDKSSLTDQLVASNASSIFNNSSVVAVNFTVPIANLSGTINTAPLSVITPWAAYTPTLVGVGTATSNVAYYRQVGTTYEVQGSFTTGTVSAAIASISLPNSAAIDSTKVSIGNTTAAAGPIVGNYGANGANQGGTILTATGTSTAVVYAGASFNASGAITPQTGTTNFPSTTNIVYHFSVPVANLYGTIPSTISTAKSDVWVGTANGYGSTATKISRYTNILINIGSDITYADSASAGSSFTINSAGLYMACTADAYASADNFGVSLNASSLTTGISSLSFANGARGTSENVANAVGAYCVVLNCLAGDVVRPHTNGTARLAAGDLSFMHVTKMSLY